MNVIHFEDQFPVSETAKALIKKACDAALSAEGIKCNVSVEIVLTDDERIHALNLENRGVDRATDVLSFPSCPFSPQKTAGDYPRLLKMAFDPDDGACFLGSIVISVPHARAQAEEYGHSIDREIAYLTTHAMFHLMGYDHMNEEDKKAMRTKEEEALKGTVLSQEDEWMLEQARKAMAMSYAPYSHFTVGACLKCTDGTFYTGCNIENASYGAANCAERTAIFKAVSEGKRSFESIAIASNGSAPWPCGICRQVMNEFSPNMRVMVTWDGNHDEATLPQLLPHSFGPKDLDVETNQSKEQA